MAKITKNLLVKGARGNPGKQYVYKTRGSRTYIARMPVCWLKKARLFSIPSTATVGIFPALLNSNLLLAQLAIIKDIDGFANIRQEPHNSSEIVDTISNEKIVFCFGEQAK